MTLRLADAVARDPSTSMAIGTVLACPGTGVVTVNLAGGILSLPHVRSYVPAVNDAVVILTQGMRRVVISAVVNPADPIAPRADAPAPSQATPTVPIDVVPVSVVKSMTFAAQSTGCYRGASWRSDPHPRQGDYDGSGINTGCWFYGTGISDALLGATVLSASVYLSRQLGGQAALLAPTLYATSNATQPAGAPTLGASTAGSALAAEASGWFAIDVAIVQSIVDGTQRGLACHVAGTSPYITLASLADSRSSGALRIGYSR